MDSSLLDKSLQLVLKKACKIKPVAVLIMGTGWQLPLRRMDVKLKIKYNDIPVLGGTRMEGHAGDLVAGKVCGMEVMVFNGRRHFYETKKWESVVFPVYLARKTGAQYLVLTNSAGSISKKNKAGTFMLIRDHINAFWDNPLLGEENVFRGDTFPDQSEIYNRALRQTVLKRAKAAKLQLQEGVYIATIGGSYETPAEIKAFKKWGADAVGSSTVPEAITASACGIKVIAISFISNYAAGLAGESLSHNRIKQFGEANSDKMSEAIKIILEVIAEDVAQ
jgi:purine-nucleoside phosphorylase